MEVETWVQRLSKQLPGWHVWYCSTAPKWSAVPAPDDIRHAEVYELPDFLSLRVGADTPQELRKLAGERYGWYDDCGNCGVPARECGHRQPERS